MCALEREREQRSDVDDLDTFHSEGLAAASLPVGENCAVESFHHAIHKPVGRVCVYSLRGR